MTAFNKSAILSTTVVFGLVCALCSACSENPFAPKSDQEKVADEFEQPLQPKRWQPVIVEYKTWDWPRQPYSAGLLNTSRMDSANLDYVKATRAAIKAYEEKNLPEAEKQFKEALTVAEAAKGNEYDLENARANMAGIYLHQKKLEDYERQLKAAVIGDPDKTYRDVSTLNKNFTDIQAKDRNQLAQMLLSKGRVDDAVFVMRTTVRSSEKSLRGRRDPISPPTGEDLAWAFQNLARQFDANERPGAANWTFQRAIWLWSELGYLAKPPYADVIAEYIDYLNKHDRGQEATSMQKILDTLRKSESKGK